MHFGGGASKALSAAQHDNAYVTGILYGAPVQRTYNDSDGTAGGSGGTRTRHKRRGKAEQARKIAKKEAAGNVKQENEIETENA